MHSPTHFLLHPTHPPTHPPTYSIKQDVEIDPSVYTMDLKARTITERQIQMLFGKKGFPDFEGIGPPVHFPSWEELGL